MMVMQRTARQAGMAVSAIALFLLSPATAAEFYKDKTLDIIVGFGAGSSYDMLSRLTARHIDRHLPGSPSVIVRNMPGAGSIRATNHLYNVAPKDGTVFGMIGQSMYQNQLFVKEALKADVTKMNWIGRLISNNAVLFAWHEAPIKTIDQAFDDELIVSASGSASRLRWSMLVNLTGIKMKLITGYKDSSEARLAMQRGEIHALSMPWMAVKAQESQWVEEGKISVLLQTATARAPDLQDVPTMMDLARNDEEREILEFFSAAGDYGRAFVAPPDLPRERVADLRGAFKAMVEDPAFLADAKKLKIEVEPLDGEELQALVSRSMRYAPDVVKRAMELTTGN